MNDALFIFKTLFRLIITYPISVVQDFLWFKLNYRPKWLAATRKKFFNRLDNDKNRLGLIRSKVRFYIKRQKDSRSL